MYKPTFDELIDSAILLKDKIGDQDRGVFVPTATVNQWINEYTDETNAYLLTLGYGVDIDSTLHTSIKDYIILKVIMKCCRSVYTFKNDDPYIANLENERLRLINLFENSTPKIVKAIASPKSVNYSNERL